MSSLISGQPCDPAGSRETDARWVEGLLHPGRLTAVFQPIVRCGYREVFGFESLLRDADEGRDAVPFDAARAFAAAREVGCGLLLDAHACRTALAEAARHRVSTRLFVNITAASLCGGLGVAEVTATLDTLRLSPHQIVFELVEGEPFTDWGRLREGLRDYRERGFQVALDDFGAAYASPLALCELRPDYVKLDRTLVRGVDADPPRAALAWRLIEAARDLGAKVIVEGVETEGEYQWARTHGVDYAQGFYISRPAAPPPFMHAAWTESARLT